jgi:vancomycin permeability regulator SanA
VDKRAINRYFFYRINAAHSFHLVTPNLNLHFAGSRALSSRDLVFRSQEKVFLLGLKIPLNRRAVDKRAINRYFFYRINAAHSFHLVTPNLKRASFRWDSRAFIARSVLHLSRKSPFAAQIRTFYFQTF